MDKNTKYGCKNYHHRQRLKKKDKTTHPSANSDDSEEWETVTHKKKPRNYPNHKPQRQQKTPSISIQVQRHRNKSSHQAPHHNRKPWNKVSVTEPSNSTDQAQNKPYHSKQRGDYVQTQPNDVRRRPSHFLGKGRKLRGKQD